MALTRAPLWATRESAVVAPARRRDVVIERFDREAILVDPRNDHSHRLNQTALVVWRACDGRSTTHEIARRLTGAYDVELDDALDCVDQLVALFARLELFETNPRPSSRRAP